jgi:hypothetical protein
VAQLKVAGPLQPPGNADNPDSMESAVTGCASLEVKDRLNALVPPLTTDTVPEADGVTSMALLAGGDVS